MNNFNKIELSYSMGTILELTQNAIKLASEYDCLVEFPFNGVKVTVSQWSNAETVVSNTLKKVRGEVLE